ncbi:MAG: hypothetical protein IJA31_07995 [Clostridia bacterium]|nr:hypothetical protein [Clostridia bacterium]
MENDINIINTDNEVIPDTNTPIAEVTLQFAPMEIEHVLNHHAKTYIKRMKRLALIAGLIFTAGAVLSFSYSYELSAFCLCAVLIVLFYCFRAIKNVKKAAHKNAQDADFTKDTFEVFEKHCKISIVKNDVLKTIYYIDYEEIDSIVEDEHYFSFVRKNLIYTLRKNDSVCNLLMDKIKANAACEAEKETKKEIKKQTASIALIAVIFISAMLPMALRNWLPYDFFTALPIQLEYFFMLIPAVVIIISIIFRKKLKTSALCITGVIVIMMLSLLAWVNGYDTEDAAYQAEQDTNAASFLQQTEEIVNFALPDSFEVLYAHEATEYENGFYAGIYISENEIEQFSKSLQNSDKWLDYTPSILAGLKPYYGETDFMLLYNEDTKQFNTLPEQSGTYSFLYMNFNTDDGFMYVERYEADYVAYE